MLRKTSHRTEKFPLESNNVLLPQFTESSVLPGIGPEPINILLVLSMLSKTLNDPVTPNEPVISALPVYGNAGVLGAYEADNACVAYEAVPSNEPVMLGAYNEFNVASEPDVITLRQLGIFYLLAIIKMPTMF